MRTIDWDQKKNCITIIDQTLLPEKLALYEIRDLEHLQEAILSMRVRGAPALGAAGGFGVALIARNIKSKNVPDFVKQLRSDTLKLKNTRPTAINLSWGVERILSRALDSDDVQTIRDIALEEAKMMAEDDVIRCRELGDHGAKLLNDGDTVLTHCNAGRLACVDWGTALGVVRSAVASGKKIKVVACETRPLNQGSRLTAWELAEDNIPVTVIGDDMSGYVMRKKMINAALVGADRIVEDAVFNKIGTYTHSVLAKAHGIPFYVAAPLSTFDFRRRERDVIVEERSPDELSRCGNRQLTPAGVRVMNPAFDATPMENISAFITEEGVFRPPLDFRALEKLKM